MNAKPKDEPKNVIRLFWINLHLTSATGLKIMMKWWSDVYIWFFKMKNLVWWMVLNQQITIQRKKNSNFKYFIAAHAKEWNWNKNKYIFFTDIIHNQFVNYRPADAHTKNSRTETVFRFYANDNKSLPKSRRMNAKKTETKQITRRLNVKNEKRKTHGTRHNHFILFLLLP